jgi:hypothetical protein
MTRLNKSLEHISQPEKKVKALERHIKYVEASARDMRAYAAKTSFLPDESREDSIGAIDRFCSETVSSLRDAQGQIRGDAT